MNTRLAAIIELERRIGHSFTDRDLLERALTHASVGDGAKSVRHNERLEFLGDRVLAPAVTPWSAIPGYILISAVISLFMNLFVAIMTRERTILIAPPAAAAVKFLDRLPLKLRGAEIWAIEAEDHYLRMQVQPTISPTTGGALLGLSGQL